MHTMCLALSLLLSMSIQCMDFEENKYDQNTYNILENGLKSYDFVYGLPIHIQGIPSPDQVNKLQEVFTLYLSTDTAIKTIMNESVKSVTFFEDIGRNFTLPLKESLQEGFKNYQNFKALSVFLNKNLFRINDKTAKVAKYIETAATSFYEALEYTCAMKDLHQQWCLIEASEIGLD